MRDYAKVAPQFWTGETGRALRSAGRDAQLVALYLITCKDASMLGLYYLPLPTLCHEVGLSREGARKALGRASEGGFAYYDEASELVWVPEMARIQIDEALKPNDNRILGVMKSLRPFLKHRFGREFYEKYRGIFHLPDIIIDKPLQRGFEGPPKPLRSQEQEQEQITENREQPTENYEQEQEPKTAEASGGGSTALVKPGGQLARLPTEPAALTRTYLACFNATFSRAVGETPEIHTKVKNLLRAKYRPWQIVAVPILADANGMDAGFRRSLRPEIPLRDGTHPRTVGGQTTGATHWLERELQRADRTVLDERLAGIAKHFGVLEQLMQLGVSLRRESGL